VVSTAAITIHMPRKLQDAIDLFSWTQLYATAVLGTPLQSQHIFQRRKAVLDVRIRRA